MKHEIQWMWISINIAISLLFSRINFRFSHNPIVILPLSKSSSAWQTRDKEISPRITRRDEDNFMLPAIGVIEQAMSYESKDHWTSDIGGKSGLPTKAKITS